MTKSEIEQATQKYSEKHIDNFHRQIGFNAGANYVNEKQPYTAEDMQGFAEWIGKQGWEYHPAYDGWKIYNEYKTTTQLLKLWEESKNG